MASVTSHPLVECPVCLEEPKEVPIYQCEKGHIICKGCYPKLALCPVCKISLAKINTEQGDAGSAIRNIIAEKLLTQKNNEVGRNNLADSLFTHMSNLTADLVKTQVALNNAKFPAIYLGIEADSTFLGRILIVLRTDVAPKTSNTFLSICKGENRANFQNAVMSEVHGKDTGQCVMIKVPNFINAGFIQEDPTLKFERGDVGLDTAIDGKIFLFIKFADVEHFSRGHLVFGRVIKGMDIIDKVAKQYQENPGKVKVKCCGVA